jgi:hypothetical protein
MDRRKEAENRLNFLPSINDSSKREKIIKIYQSFIEAQYTFLESQNLIDKEQYIVHAKSFRKNVNHILGSKEAKKIFGSKTDWNAIVKAIDCG